MKKVSTVKNHNDEKLDQEMGCEREPRFPVPTAAEVSVGEIDVSTAYQFRETLDEDTLATSIGEAGVVNPPAVVRYGDRYMLVTGHRRLAAAKAAGLERIPVRVYDQLTEEQRLELAGIDNLARKNLSPREQAAFVFRLLGSDYTKTHISQIIGLKERQVQKYSVIFGADDSDLQNRVEAGKVSIAAAYSLAQSKASSPPSKQTEPTEPENGADVQPAEPAEPDHHPDPELQDLEARCQALLDEDADVPDSIGVQFVFRADGMINFTFSGVPADSWREMIPQLYPKLAIAMDELREERCQANTVSKTDPDPDIDDDPDVSQETAGAPKRKFEKHRRFSDRCRNPTV